MEVIRAFIGIFKQYLLRTLKVQRKAHPTMDKNIETYSSLEISWSPLVSLTFGTILYDKMLAQYEIQQGLEIRGFWFQKKTVQLKTALREVYTYVLKGLFFQKTVQLQGFSVSWGYCYVVQCTLYSVIQDHSVKRWLPDDCLMTTWRLPDDCVMTAW